LVVGTVELVDGKLEQVGFDGRGHAFVNNEEKSCVHVFDTHTLKALGTWSLAPGEGGTGLAVDAVHHRTLSSCGNNKLVVLNSDTGAVVATPEIGEDPDGVVFDPATGLVFTSNVVGTLSILHQDSPDTYSTVQTVQTAVGARTLAYDPASGRVFLVTAKVGPVPPATASNPNPKAAVLPNTFELLVVSH
jgi:DNA-binding beta-propeller fold protein YncE